MKLKWFYRGDLDGFFGLFIDNLLQLMLISVLCQYVVGLPGEMVIGRILPGAALSILIGNAFYAWQAKKLAESTHRPNTTALLGSPLPPGRAGPLWLQRSPSLQRRLSGLRQYSAADEPIRKI